MNELYPIIRRVRRPLLPVEPVTAEAAAPIKPDAGKPTQHEPRNESSTHADGSAVPSLVSAPATPQPTGGDE